MGEVNSKSNTFTIKKTIGYSQRLCEPPVPELTIPYCPA